MQHSMGLGLPCNCHVSEQYTCDSHEEGHGLGVQKVSEPMLQSLRPMHVWELEPSKALVAQKQVRLLTCQGPCQSNSRLFCATIKVLKRPLYSPAVELAEIHHGLTQLHRQQREADRPMHIAVVTLVKEGTGKLTQQLLDDIELINVAIPRKQGLAINELSHDAAYCPHVHLLPIVAAAEQQLWRPVPPAHLSRLSILCSSSEMGLQEPAMRACCVSHPPPPTLAVAQQQFWHSVPPAHCLQ